MDQHYQEGDWQGHQGAQLQLQGNQHISGDDLKGGGNSLTLLFVSLFLFFSRSHFTRRDAQALNQKTVFSLPLPSCRQCFVTSWKNESGSDLK